MKTHSLVNYSVRRGVALSQIMGRIYLVASRAAWGFCPQVKEINEAAADVWKLICEGRSDKEMELYIAGKYDISRLDAREGLLSFAAQLEAQGYLINLEKKDE